MEHKLTMVYWKGEKFWLGKLKEHPEIMTQEETIEELEENIKDAYRYLNPGTRQKQSVPRHTAIDNALAMHMKKYLGIKV